MPYCEDENDDAADDDGDDLMLGYSESACGGPGEPRLGSACASLMALLLFIVAHPCASVGEKPGQSVGKSMSVWGGEWVRGSPSASPAHHQHLHGVGLGWIGLDLVALAWIGSSSSSS